MNKVQYLKSGLYSEVDMNKITDVLFGRTICISHAGNSSTDMRTRVFDVESMENNGFEKKGKKNIVECIFQNYSLASSIAAAMTRLTVIKRL